MVDRTAAASGIGAGVSQGRIQRIPSEARLREQSHAAPDMRTAALELIRRVLSPTESAVHDLDLLA